MWCMRAQRNQCGPALLERVLGKEAGSLRGDDIDQVLDTLIRSATRSVHRVLVIDQAHRLAPEVLDPLMLMSSLMGSRPPLLRSGPDRPAGPVEVLRPTSQSGSTAARAAIDPLSEAEAARYLDYRLAQGGQDTARILTEGAVSEILRAGPGIRLGSTWSSGRPGCLVRSGDAARSAEVVVPGDGFDPERAGS